MWISCCNLQLPVIVILGEALVAKKNPGSHGQLGYPSQKETRFSTPVSQPPGLPQRRQNSVSDPLGIESKTTGGRLKSEDGSPRKVRWRRKDS